MRAAPLRAPDRLVEAVQEQHAVGQPGQRVVERVVLEALLGLAAARDVGLGADDAGGAPVRLAHRDPAREHPAVGAVAVLDPVLGLEVLGGAGQVALERLREPGAVVGVHAAEPLARRVADLGLGVADHRLPARREVQPVGAHVPVPQPVVGALERERVALLGLGEPAQRPLVGDRVAQAALERGGARVHEVVRDAQLGRRQVGGPVGAVVEQDHRRVPGVGEDVARDVQPRVAGVVQLAVDQERVVRVLVERGQRGARRRHPVDLVHRALDRLQRGADGRVRGLLGLHDEQHDALEQPAHAAPSGGRTAVSSQ